MFKLIKYELRATFLTIIGTCISVILANLFLMTKNDSWGTQPVTALSVCVIIAAIIVIFISSLKIMSKYLHEDSGYLLFTLPQSGISILTSRLLTALIQISIVGFVSLLMFYFTVMQGIDLSFLKDVDISVIPYTIIGYILSTFYSLTFIYFCMVIGKVALKNKKLGKIGSFILFIILSSLMSWLAFKIGTAFPQTLNLGGSALNNSFKSTTSSFTISDLGLNINIANSIFDIITFAGFFFSTSYLIDKKLDLS